MPKRLKVPKGWNSRDVEWYAPGRNNPVAFSTKSTKDLIMILAQDHETINQVHDAINFDGEAKKVLQKFIDLGHGEMVARKYFLGR